MRFHTQTGTLYDKIQQHSHFIAISYSIMKIFIYLCGEIAIYWEL